MEFGAQGTFLLYLVIYKQTDLFAWALFQGQLGSTCPSLGETHEKL